MIDEEIRNIKSLIGKSKIEEAIEQIKITGKKYLKKSTWFEFEKTSILIEQDYSNNQKEKIKGTITRDDYNVKRTDISDRLLDCLKNIKKESLDTSVFFYSNFTLNQQIQLLSAIMGLLVIKSPLTIEGEEYKLNSTKHTIEKIKTQLETLNNISLDNLEGFLTKENEDLINLKILNILDDVSIYYDHVPDEIYSLSLGEPVLTIDEKSILDKDFSEKYVDFKIVVETTCEINVEIEVDNEDDMSYDSEIKSALYRSRITKYLDVEVQLTLDVSCLATIENFELLDIDYFVTEVKISNNRNPITITENGHYT